MAGLKQNRYKTNNGCIKHLPQTGLKLMQDFRVEVTFYLLRVQYPWCHCFLCLSAEAENSGFSELCIHMHILNKTDDNGTIDIFKGF